jgi:hypothetical protein
MLKGNLSTRPFYNERSVNLLLLAAAVAGVALTVFNVTRILEYSSARSQRVAVQKTAESEAARIRAAAEREQQSVDRTTLGRLGAETYEANDLIDQRLFSWTVFFGLVEKTIPLDVRLVAVSPSVDRGERRIDMIVNAKRPEDLSTFLDALQNTGAFYDMLASAQQRNEDGTYDATLSGGYLPPAPTAASAKASTPAAGGARRP